MLTFIDDPKIDWLGKRVFCRLDLNISMGLAGEIKDDTRIQAALPTIQYLLEKGAKLILASHLGRPKGKPRADLSLEPIAARLHELLDCEIIFAHDCIGDGIKRLISELKPGSLMMLENLRFHSNEEKNEESFAKLLAQSIDVYVNDAFGAAHRPHASVEAITRYVPMKCAGFLIRKEIENLGRLTSNPQKPFVAILGGAKVSDKIGVVAQLLTKIDTLLIGGAMAYTFLRARGLPIGKSKFEEERLNLASLLLKKASSLGVQVLLPKDHVVVSEFKPDAPTRVVSLLDSDDIGIDIGPATLTQFEQAIAGAKTIFWNGPVGLFEWETGFGGTLGIAQAIAETNAFSVVGGGESIAALHQAGVADKISHISTGGGASLEYIQGAELPGLAALKMV
ncbi:MAG: phosphoglycerate kinase [Myxococcaceae bacterium]